MPTTRRVRRRKTSTKRRRPVSKTKRNRPRNRRGTRVARGQYGDADMCPVCLRTTEELREAGVTFCEMKPCEHQICEYCFGRLDIPKKCPICRTNVERLVNRTTEQQLWTNVEEDDDDDEDDEDDESYDDGSEESVEEGTVNNVQELMLSYDHNIHDYFNETIITPQLRNYYGLPRRALRRRLSEYLTNINWPMRFFGTSIAMRFFNSVAMALYTLPIDVLHSIYNHFTQQHAATATALRESFINWASQDNIRRFYPEIFSVNWSQPPIHSAVLSQFLAYILATQVIRRDYHGYVDELFGWEREDDFFE